MQVVDSAVPSLVAAPGRPRRRVKRRTRTALHTRPATSYRADLKITDGARGSTPNSRIKLAFAVLLWYSLGVISISTSKILLSESREDFPANGVTSAYEYIGGVPPLLLTLQQLLLGSTFLRCLLALGFMDTSGLQTWSSLLLGDSDRKKKEAPKAIDHLRSVLTNEHTNFLVKAGLCFSLGFYVTNMGFGGASASFVETVKAAEPITSAALAVSYRIEVLGALEIWSLGAIISGVALSTIGNAPHDNNTSSAYRDSVISCTVVMFANLCFSFRGLYQKLFRAALTRSDSKAAHVLTMDDLNVQFKMQQLGVWLLFLPALLWYGYSTLRYVHLVQREAGLLSSGILGWYLCLSVVNGIAFASYNLASTYILSRISVVHHAALNCIRRIFAVVVTSLLFRVTVTFLGIAGIVISFAGFMVFSFAKSRRIAQSETLPFVSIGSRQRDCSV